MKRGETVWQIAQYYGTRIKQIALLNELDDPNVLVVGQALVVPDPGRDYVVQPGDTLATIADRFGVTTQALAAANNISDPSLIYAGQMLENPNVTHTAQADESIWDIAQRYGVSIRQLLVVNQMGTLGLTFPGQTIQIPAAKTAIEAYAYTMHVGDTGQSKVLRLGRHLTYLGPFTYRFTEDGMLTELSDQPVLQAAAETNTTSTLVVANQVEGGFDADRAATLLRDSDIQETFITNLLEKLHEKNYAGVNFDFEYVYPEDRENYNAFLRRAVYRLHTEGFFVSTAVAPKQSATQQGLIEGGIDYQAHGAICDYVMLMTYEWGWAGGRPLAISPLNEIRGVLNYAVSVMPRNKILMGMSLYGRDWKIPWEEGTIAKTLSPKEAVQLAANYGAFIQYDDTYQAPFFRYTDENGQRHEVWFEDARSAQAKYHTVKAYGVRGVGYWSLDFSFPQNWAVLQSQFNVQ